MAVKKNHPAPGHDKKVIFPMQVFFFFNLFILFLFLAALGLHCCTRAFSSCNEQGLLLVVVHKILIAVTSLVAEHWL